MSQWTYQGRPVSNIRVVSGYGPPTGNVLGMVGGRVRVIPKKELRRSKEPVAKALRPVDPVASLSPRGIKDPVAKAWQDHVSDNAKKGEKYLREGAKSSRRKNRGQKAAAATAAGGAGVLAANAGLQYVGSSFVGNRNGGAVRRNIPYLRGRNKKGLKATAASLAGGAVLGGVAGGFYAAGEKNKKKAQRWDAKAARIRRVGREREVASSLKDAK